MALRGYQKRALDDYLRSCEVLAGRRLSDKQKRALAKNFFKPPLPPAVLEEYFVSRGIT